MKWLRWLTTASVLALTFALGANLSGATGLHRNNLPFGKYPSSRSSKGGSGKQLVLVYFGKSTCVWSVKPEVATNLARIRGDLEKTARVRGESLVLIGASLDQRVGDGVRHLAGLGPFDEIAVGSGWTNSLVLSKLWDGVGTPATPQLLLLERDVIVDGAYRTGDEKPIVRKVGLREIEDWAALGTPVPQTARTSPAPQ